MVFNGFYIQESGDMVSILVKHFEKFLTISLNNIVNNYQYKKDIH